MFLDELQKAPSVDLGPNRRYAVGVRARQFRLGHVRALLLHAVVRQDIDDAYTVEFSACRTFGAAHAEWFVEEILVAHVRWTF